MRSTLYLTLAIGVVTSPLAHGAEACAPLPAALQNYSVSYIADAAELQKLDNQLEARLRACLLPPTADTIKAICTNGNVVAEQVLRLIARIDAEGKTNAVLGNAKMKSYKTTSTVIERVKKLNADRACP